jgi:hypothetical protein
VQHGIDDTPQPLFPLAPVVEERHGEDIWPERSRHTAQISWQSKQVGIDDQDGGATRLYLGTEKVNARHKPHIEAEGRH